MLRCGTSNSIRASLGIFLAFLASFLGGLLASPTAHSAPACDAVPRVFQAKEPFYINELQRQALEVLSEETPSQDRAVKLQRLASELESPLATVATALLGAFEKAELDWTRVDVASQFQANEAETLQLSDRRVAALAIEMRTATTRAQVDRMVERALSRSDDPAFKDLLNLSGWRAILKQHIAVFGNSSRQSLLWKQVYNATQPAGQLDVLQDQLASAQRAKNGRYIFDTKLNLLNALTSTAKEKQTTRVVSILGEIRQEAMARLRRLATLADDTSNYDIYTACLPIEIGGPTTVLKAIYRSGSEEEFDDLLSLAGPLTAIDVLTGTDDLGFIINAETFLGLRFANRALFLQGLHYLKFGVAIDPNDREIIALSQFMDALAFITDYNAARVLEDDIIQQFPTWQNRKSKAALPILIQLVEFELDHGRIEQAEQLFAQLTELSGLNKSYSTGNFDARILAIGNKLANIRDHAHILTTNTTLLISKNSKINRSDWINFEKIIKSIFGANTTKHMTESLISAFQFEQAAWDQSPGDHSVDFDRFIDFMKENNYKNKLKKWSKYLENCELGGTRCPATDTDYITHLFDTANFFDEIGYKASERVLLEQIVQSMRMDDKLPFRQLAAKRNVALARVMVPTYARLAEISYRNSELTSALNYSRNVKAVALERLSQEWVTGNERIGVVFRELQPALQLSAQVLLAIAAESDASNESIKAEAVDAVQVSMLGDNALTSIGSVRKVSFLNPSVNDALQLRDKLRRELAGLDSFSGYISELDPRIYDRERASLLPLVEQAEKSANDALPLPEDLITPMPMPLDAIREKLAPDEGLLILHAGSDDLFGVLATKGEPTQIWSTKITLASLSKRIAIIRRGVDLSAGALPRFPVNDAADLLDMLLGSTKMHAYSLKRLNVVADGPLLSLPLGILPMKHIDDEPNSAAQYGDSGIEWFALGPALDSLPSVKSLEARGQPVLASKGARAFAGIGNPKLNGTVGTTRSVDANDILGKEPLANVDSIRALAPLPDTEIEIKAMANALGADTSDLRLGEAATVTAIKKMQLSDYRIVAFATHALVAGELHGYAEPGLVMTPPIVASADDDGVLKASDIARMKLDADLVVLSACNTAAADGKPGAEGLSGLARSFISAGAKSMVVTHWAIPSKQTVGITTGMIEAVHADHTLGWAEALRLATIKLIKETGPSENAHPAYWGAFAIYGTATRQ